MGKYYLVAVPFADTLPQHYSVAVHAESEELQDASEYSVLDVAVVVWVFVWMPQVFLCPLPKFSDLSSRFAALGALCSDALLHARLPLFPLVSTSILGSFCST